jgi:uridylate kinase
MRATFNKIIIISLGGSVVAPDGVNSRFIGGFVRLIARCAKYRKKFVVVVGGGRTCRGYQAAAKSAAPISSDDLDWIGIYATRLNATLVRAAFGKRAAPALVENPGKVRKLAHPVTVGGGWKPGWSTDFVTAVLAKNLGVKEIVNVGKPQFVYDKNPDAHKDAKPYFEVSWKKYRAQMPKNWKPGFSAPVDPVAAKFCEKNKMTMFVVGADVKNLVRLLNGREFEGTIISS